MALGFDGISLDFLYIFFFSTDFSVSWDISRLFVTRLFRLFLNNVVDLNFIGLIYLVGVTHLAVTPDASKLGPNLSSGRTSSLSLTETPWAAYFPEDSCSK